MQWLYWFSPLDVTLSFTPLTSSLSWLEETPTSQLLDHLHHDQIETILQLSKNPGWNALTSGGYTSLNTSISECVCEDDELESESGRNVFFSSRRLHHQLIHFTFLHFFYVTLRGKHITWESYSYTGTVQQQQYCVSSANFPLILSYLTPISPIMIKHFDCMQQSRICDSSHDMCVTYTHREREREIGRRQGMRIVWD